MPFLKVSVAKAANICRYTNPFCVIRIINTCKIVAKCSFAKYKLLVSSNIFCINDFFGGVYD